MQKYCTFRFNQVHANLHGTMAAVYDFRKRIRRVPGIANTVVSNHYLNRKVSIL